MKTFLILCFLQIPVVTYGAKCTYDGTEYDKGVSFPSNDGCNTCYCEGNGFVSCTEGCLPGGTSPDNCVYNGQTYKIGDAFLAEDGCNSCTCERDKRVPCTKKACVKPKAKCKDADGLEHTEGDRMPAEDGCNTCVCTKSGMFICTLEKCPPPATKRPSSKDRRKGDMLRTNSATLSNSVNYWIAVVMCMLIAYVK